MDMILSSITDSHLVLVVSIHSVSVRSPSILDILARVVTGRVVTMVNSSGLSRRFLSICSYTECNMVSTAREFVPGTGDPQV